MYKGKKNNRRKRRQRQVLEIALTGYNNAVFKRTLKGSVSCTSNQDIAKSVTTLKVKSIILIIPAALLAEC